MPKGIVSYYEPSLLHALHVLHGHVQEPVGSLIHTLCTFVASALSGHVQFQVGLVSFYYDDFPGLLKRPNIGCNRFLFHDRLNIFACPY